jgi:hypothetical protein
MKKIFTLFVAGLLGLGAFAQPCPSKMELQLKDAADPANVTFEFVLAQNTSEWLNGWNVEFTKPEGATWKRAQGANYVTAKGYAAYILERINLDGATVADFTNDELEDMLGDFLDNKSSVKNNGATLMFIQVLSTNECRYYPTHAGAVGMGKVDISALPDGEYEFKTLVDAEGAPTAGGSSFSYTGGPEVPAGVHPEEGNWIMDEPVSMILKKEGDSITQVTGITTIAVDKPADNRIFDLQGRELQSVPEHGIYIQNGKKYVK